MRANALFIHENKGLFYVAVRTGLSSYEIASKGFVSKKEAKEELDAQREHAAMVKYRS